jgi:hypothetical protein
MTLSVYDQKAKLLVTETCVGAFTQGNSDQEQSQDEHFLIVLYSIAITKNPTGCPCNPYDAEHCRVLWFQVDQLVSTSEEISSSLNTYAFLEYQYWQEFDWINFVIVGWIAWSHGRKLEFGHRHRWVRHPICTIPICYFLNRS